MAKKDRIDRLFQNFCQAIEKIHGVIDQQKPEDDKPYIVFTVEMDGSHYAAMMVIDPDTMVFTILLHINALISQWKSRECAVILNMINSWLPMGGFSADNGGGLVYYEMATPFENCQFTPEALAGLAGFAIIAASRFEPLLSKFQFDELTVDQVVELLPPWEVNVEAFERESEEMFARVKSMISGKNADFEADDDRLELRLKAKNGRQFVPIRVCVDAPWQQIRITSDLPFAVSPLRRVDMAGACCSVSYALSEGTMVYDIFKNCFYYTTTGTYGNSRITDAYIDHLITSAVAAVEKYGQQLQLLNEGHISLKSFLSQI